MSGMQAKTIRKALKGKINHWLRSIKDDKVRELAEKNTIVTGGCITSMLLGEEINDFDVYFRDHETTLAIANYYVDQFHNRKKSQGGIPVSITVEDLNGQVSIKVKSAGVASVEQTDNYDYFESHDSDDETENYVMNAMAPVLNQTMERQSKKEYEAVFLSTNAITLTNQIQLVLRFYGTPEEIHKNYDFVHCTNYYDHANSELVLHPKALECILSRTLIYSGSLYPIASVIRTRKFIQRGWKISAGQYLKMVMQISELDLQNVTVLQDQLTGVDAAYFSEIISKIQSDNPEKIDSSYLAKIIDEMF